jgi:hypothetical protein
MLPAHSAQRAQRGVERAPNAYSTTHCAAGPLFVAQVLAAPASREGIVPYIKMFQTLIRRRPFLIKALENTLIKLIMSMEFFDEEGRKKIAIGGLGGRCCRRCWCWQDLHARFAAMGVVEEASQQGFIGGSAGGGGGSMKGAAGRGWWQGARGWWQGARRLFRWLLEGGTGS